ncbi:alpha-amylase family glycosyl hydrolase [Hallella seregens]|uniref:Alpha-amylase family glycosyl hydrolase n=1 Tax=Hallella seregens ATCC 51272 TaxID=1336250 RepID=A0ABV5ZHK8_9BACT|nr:alpha-amylase family glycosyl hydrolase [Hallella seregens]
MNSKLFIYQVLPRLFGNPNSTRKKNGTLLENGVGKMNDFDAVRLRRIRGMGFTHVWYTGVIRHATTTDYSCYGIPRQHASVTKGKAGSPYAITDYYDIDPDLAVDVPSRMAEFEALVQRTHEADMKVIIDFVPNHVAREYHSIARPAGVRDLGQDDRTDMHFSPRNNFYYCPGQPFVLPVGPAEGEEPYVEMPARCTGNDRFDNHPGVNDWYETVKLNYGVDYCDAGGRSFHYDPVPGTWSKMTDILLFWASKGIDAFRCDMAEMVPSQFWAYATRIVKLRHPHVDFIGEVYDTAQYRTYIQAGFDYLYDKVGMYDCVRDVICGHRPASSITYCWQSVDDIKDHMLYFLENHDEQRIASDAFCGDANRALPGVILLAMLQQNPFMVYAGQELGERGMDEEGFSGRDGRTTIFDYWQLEKLYRGYFDRQRLDPAEKCLQLRYQQILHLANREAAVREGKFFDLMYVNPQTWKFNPRHQFAFLRKHGDEVLLIVVNFSGERVHAGVVIPGHAFDFLHMPERGVTAIDLLTGQEMPIALQRDGTVDMDIRPYDGRIYKFSISMDENPYVLNVHAKDEFPPAHTAEHLLNQVMMRMFGCGRSANAHIERKKSKMSFVLDRKPTRKEEKAIEEQMNALIDDDLPVTFDYVDRHNLPEGVSLDRLPKDSSDTIRLVRIGDFDVCPCIGKHVRSTAQIGRFELLGTNWDQPTMTFRVRFKVHP